MEKITRLVSELNNALSSLQELAEMTEEGFIRDRHKTASAKYNMIVAIESVIDICNHLISNNNFRVPEDYGDTFKIMGENNLLPEEFAGSLIEMARFRNRLVNLYWKVDSKVLYNIIQNDRRDFIKFIKILNEWINT
jgi:uncharacterized protein YutE (UPF0331/DUF86 family)